MHRKTDGNKGQFFGERWWLQLMTGARRREQRSSHNIRHFKNANHTEEAFLSLEMSSNHENSLLNIIIYYIMLFIFIVCIRIIKIE